MSLRRVTVVKNLMEWVASIVVAIVVAWLITTFYLVDMRCMDSQCILRLMIKTI